MKLTYFEKFKKAVTGVWKSFFEDELLEEAPIILIEKAEKIVEIIGADVKSKKSKKYGKSERLRIIEDVENCVLFAYAYQKKAKSQIQKALDEIGEKELGKLKMAGIESIKNVKKKKQLKDTLYKTGNLTDIDGYHKDGDDENQSICRKLFEFMYDFNFEGRKIFRVEEQLMEELLLTQFSNVEDSFFVLPYNTICIHVPYNKHLSVRGKTTEWIFLTQWIEENSKDVEVLCVSDDGCVDSGTFSLCGGDIIKQIVKQTNEKWESALAKREMKELFSFVISTLLYINSTDNDLKKIQPRVLDRKTDSALEFCSLGSSIKLDRRIRYAREEDIDASPAAGDHEFYVLKWTVRGHFRKQPIGHGRQDRKLLWIRPFIKGKERLNEDIDAKPTVYAIGHNKQER